MVSIVRRDIGWGIGGGIRTVFLSGLLLSVRDISRLTTVDVGGTSGMVHVPVSVGSSYRYIRVRVSNGVVGIVVRSVDRGMTITVVVRGIHGSMATGDHGRAGRPAHMNLLVPRSLSGRQEAGQQKKRNHIRG